jgi:alkylated DNA repair dioxygenase AlkB
MEEYGPLPDFATILVDRIMENKLMANTPNHLLINEYNAGQGIMPHTGNTLTSILLVYFSLTCGI